MGAGLIPIVISHQGRRGDGDYLSSMEQHAYALQSLVKGANVIYSDSFADSDTESAASGLKQGDILVLKNVRDNDDEKKKFASAKESSESDMVRFMSRLAGIYINDAPATMHRSDTSLTGFVNAMPSYLGLQMEKELRILEEIKSNIRSGKDTAIIFGGKKWEKFDYVYEVGKNRNVRILCGGIPGQSVCYAKNSDSFNEENKKFLSETGTLETAQKLADEFAERVVYPTDFVLEGGEHVSISELRSKKGPIADIGDNTIDRFFREISGSEMIIYAGPVGRYEKGYNQTIRLITRFMGEKALNYTLGGNSADSMDDIGLDKAYDILGGKRITSGGAALAYIAGKDLPVLDAFKNKSVSK